jgi:hypothetical protein
MSSNKPTITGALHSDLLLPTVEWQVIGPGSVHRTQKNQEEKGVLRIKRSIK